MDPKSDVVFKKIFGHHADLLKGMLKGREEGKQAALRDMARKKLDKGKTTAQIADEMDITEADVQTLLQ